MTAYLQRLLDSGASSTSLPALGVSAVADQAPSIGEAPSLDAPNDWTPMAEIPADRFGALDEDAPGLQLSEPESLAVPPRADAGLDNSFDPPLRASHPAGQDGPSSDEAEWTRPQPPAMSPQNRTNQILGPSPDAVPSVPDRTGREEMEMGEARSDVSDRHVDPEPFNQTRPKISPDPGIADEHQVQETARPSAPETRPPRDPEHASPVAEDPARLVLPAASVAKAPSDRPDAPAFPKNAEAHAVARPQIHTSDGALSERLTRPALPVTPAEPDLRISSPPPRSERKEQEKPAGSPKVDPVRLKTGLAGPAKAASAPRSAASISQIGPLTNSSRPRRIHGLRWR